MLKIGWFSTGRDEAARKLFRAVKESIDSGYIGDARISFVFSNREPGESRESDLFFNLVRSYGADLICFSHRKFKPEMRRRGLKETKALREDSKTLKEWRIQYDREIMKRVGTYSPDLNVLAGYMLIVGEEMCKKYVMINLHPAPPGGPKGTWQEVMWKLIRGGAKEAGATIHLVTEKLDEGPPITYFTFPIAGQAYGPLWRSVREKGIEKIMREEGESNALFKKIRWEEERREIPLLIETLRMFSKGLLKVERGKILFQGEERRGGVCLNGLVERALMEGVN